MATSWDSMLLIRNRTLDWWHAFANVEHKVSWSTEIMHFWYVSTWTCAWVNDRTGQCLKYRKWKEFFFCKNELETTSDTLAPLGFCMWKALKDFCVSLVDWLVSKVVIKSKKLARSPTENTLFLPEPDWKTDFGPTPNIFRIRAHWDLNFKLKYCCFECLFFYFFDFECQAHLLGLISIYVWKNYLFFT